MEEEKTRKIMKVATELRIARSREEIEEFQRALFTQYCDVLGWFDPDDFPGRIMTDRYDRTSVFVTVKKEGRLIGGTRLVRSSELPFPHEHYLLTPLPMIRGQAPEMIAQRLGKIDRSSIMEVTKTFGTSRTNMTTKDLTKILYWFGKFNSIEAYYMVMDMSFFMLCDRINAPVNPIATPGFIEGSWSVPSIVFVEEIKEMTTAKNPEFWDYLRDESNLIGDWQVF